MGWGLGGVEGWSEGGQKRNKLRKPVVPVQPAPHLNTTCRSWVGFYFIIRGHLCAHRSFLFKGAKACRPPASEA